ncbi:hypothetical protein DB30_04328 [Enhygromyxa salina]|uniref:Sulfatase-modifying factor enzyme-like domain-containing protein n=1 Tax=Enhygromyxa salina TaxID=215803 RepID=A0A0C2D997_9BACT|nr:SUMF1/EgtB/PvdO family nonheme iron enzyme [Enhygromyxa salina]KIG16557.1 hypothetical protein DB30_04328 [Enhygromyxa salina]
MDVSATQLPPPSQSQTRRLVVSNVRVIEHPGGTYDVSFDLDWREAFRAGEHWSAAWLFLKVKPGKTEEVESVEDAVERLHAKGSVRAKTAEIAATVRAELAGVKSLLAKLPKPPSVLPGSGGEGPTLAGIPLPGGGPPSPAQLLAGLDAKLQDTFGDPPPPIQALRLHQRRVASGGQQVEVDEDFAFLNPSSEGKQRVTSFTAWQHMNVSTLAADHGAPEGTVIVPSEDGVGVFIYRDRDGRGPLGLRGVRLRTTTACDGEALKVWIGALEMVYVAPSEFRVGDPQGADGPYCCFYEAGDDDDDGRDRSYVIRSEAAIAVGDEPGMLTWDNTGQMGEHADIPAAFPKGSVGYYVLKHQLTQGEYCDFINHLQGHQITIRFPYGGQGDYRYTVFKTWGSPRVCTRPERANNWASWADAKAYIWWAGLRPMTEFEYEKAARGPIAPVAGEYAWGSTTLVQSLVILGHESDRPIVQGNCNLGNAMQPFQGGDGGQGPVPDDAFRASRYQCSAEAVHMPGVIDTDQTFTWREETGASHYEIMGLSGNLWEYVISAGVDTGRSFTGDHGTGDLDGTGSPNQANSWPGADHLGIGFRGGSWYTKVTSGRIADRCFGSGLLGYQDRSHDTGIRAVRTAPKTEAGS